MNPPGRNRSVVGACLQAIQCIRISSNRLQAGSYTRPHSCHSVSIRGSIASSRFKRTAGFTLVELLIGMALSLLVMSAVLTSYVFLGRNFTRSLGLGSMNQPTLESQGRRALAYFARDVRMASGISGSPSANAVTLSLPTSFGTTTVTYTYDTTDSTNKKLVRTPAGGAPQTLHTNLQSFYLRYYDASGWPFDNSAPPYTTFTDYLSGIKQVSMTFSSQAGKGSNGTLTQVYQMASSRLLIRNKQLLP
jgi:prepilin-type N-terminal cleavage/methylation domain-containing protein